jgi:hypothetical protein
MGTEYLGFIALVPRTNATMWIQRHVVSPVVPILQAFSSDTAWEEDQSILPALGRRLTVTSGGTKYVAWQYTIRNDADVLAIACRYAREYLAPGGKFAADVEMRQAEGATLVEIVDDNPQDGKSLDEQIKEALLNMTT